MIRNSSLWVLAAVAALALTPPPTRAEDETLDELQEQAIKAAVKNVAASVVKIETSGGTEVIRAGRGPRGGLVRRGVGPQASLPPGSLLTRSFASSPWPSWTTL